jgi:virginiamycin B lyase
VSIVIAALLVLATPAGAATITEYPVQPTGGPSGSHLPTYITASPLGTLWFTDMGSETAVRAIDVNGLPIATITDPGSEFTFGPDLGFAPDGTLYWVINEPFVSGLGSRSPSGVVTIADNNDVKEGYALGFDPLGVAYYTARHKSPAYWALCGASCGGNGTEGELTDLTLGPEGAFWGPSENRFVKLGGLAVDLPEGTNPIRSVLGPDGNFWIAAIGTLATQNRIVRVTPSGQQTSFVLPPERAPNDITVGPDGALWFTEFTSNSIGRLTTGGEYSSCQLPNASANPRPYGITAGPDGAIWFTERSGAAIGRLSGNCTPQPLAAADTVPPRLRALTLTPRSFHAARSGASISTRGGKGKAPIGTKVSFSLSERSSVTFTVESRSKGRKVGKRCAKPGPSNTGKKSCVRWTKVKRSINIAGKSGANSFIFRGRLAGKALRSGGYRLNGLAKDAANNVSATQRKSFTILP